MPEDALLLHEAAPAAHDLVRAPRALEVARVRDLDEQVVDRVEATRHLAQLGQRRRRRGRRRGRRAARGCTAHARDQQLAAELEAERGARGSGCGRGRSPGSAKARAAEAAQARGLGLPALLGGLVEALPRLGRGRSRRTAGGTRRSAARGTRPRPRGRRPPGGGTPRAGRSRGSRRTRSGRRQVRPWTVVDLPDAVGPGRHPDLARAGRPAATSTSRRSGPRRSRPSGRRRAGSTGCRAHVAASSGPPKPERRGDVVGPARRRAGRRPRAPRR